jgi:hypothetical protein
MGVPFSGVTSLWSLPPGWNIYAFQAKERGRPEIDRLVYELYGLTDDEIKIVEGAI